MKKLVVLFFALFAVCSCAYARDAEVINHQYTIDAQNRIDKIGFKILNSNGIDKRTVFDFDIKRTKNAYSRYADRQIVIYRGLYDRLSSDDEVASVLSHEIAHSVDSYNGILKGYFTFWNSILTPRKYEYKADKRAVDYMVNAGYNPLALIVTYSKTLPQRRYEWYSTHPVTSRRMMEVYEYIYKKYPEYLVNNKYKDNPYYQNFLLTSKENRAKFQKKVESGSKSYVKYQ